MTARETAHRITDMLPEEHLADVLDYLAGLNDGDASVSPETKAAIDEGLDDIRNGRTIALAEYRRTRRL